MYIELQILIKYLINLYLHLLKVLFLVNFVGKL